MKAAAKSILEFFLNKLILVEIEEFKIKGKLVYFREGYKTGHLPTVLILKNEQGLHILRAWSVIKTWAIKS